MKALTTNCCDRNASHLTPTPAQKLCIAHQLRNAQAALECLCALVENKAFQANLNDFLAAVTATEIAISKIRKSLMKGSFCCLRPDECKFVAPFVGCNGKKIP